ncbi:hypothetical protein BH24DEI2_BH24DEI2_02340 [soil metagenome]
MALGHAAESLGEVAGAPFDGAFQHPVARLQRKVQKARLEQVAHPQQQVDFLKRFRQKVAHAAFQSVQAHVLAGERGHHQNGQVVERLPGGAYSVQNLQPAHKRHGDVEHDEVGLKRGDVTESLPRVVHTQNVLVPSSPQQVFQQHQHTFLVVHEQDARAREGVNRVGRAAL